jgi:hypothetical protein
MENFVYENSKALREYDPKTPCSSETYVKDKSFVKVRRYPLNNGETVVPFLREIYNLLFLRNLKANLLRENYHTFRGLYGRVDCPILYSLKIKRDNNEIKISLEEEFIAGKDDNNLRLYFEKVISQKRLDRLIEELTDLNKSISTLMAFKEKIGYFHGDFYLRHLIKKVENNKPKIYLIDHELAIPLCLYTNDENFIGSLIEKEHGKLVNQEWMYLNKYLDSNGLSESEKRKIKQKIKAIIKKAKKEGKEFVNDLFYKGLFLEDIIYESHKTTLRDLENNNIKFKGFEIKGKRPFMLFEISKY